MARNKIFTETFTYNAEAPMTQDEEFYLVKDSVSFSNPPARGETAELNYAPATDVVNDKTYYITIYVNGEEVHDEAGLAFNPTPDPITFNTEISIPDAQTIDVTIEGGYDGGSL